MPKLAIVGAGIMGANHGRVAGSIREFTVTAVCDNDLERAAMMAKPHDALATSSIEEAIDAADCVVLATPSETHAELGTRVLKSGRDLLVEKPIATSAADARALIEAAEANNRILMVGHIERFNPAVTELVRLVQDPVALEITRVGPFTGRLLADVVLDLMIHDIDLARAAIGSEIVHVSAVGRAVRSGDIDLATALLTFENGVIANITASRVSQTKIRRISLTQRDNAVVADLLRQHVEVHRIEHSEYLSDGGARYRQSGLVEIPFLAQHGEPLMHELRHFAACVQERRTPLSSGIDGLAALEVAISIRDQILAG
ncbi:Gfo/Idh/MocA family oxidoreductase [Virgisporangium ochraceum]|uniref:Oxidoreductase n=1 Tax=Virgisporangium ochraceum TaxID=65505 RepID=A0A8J4A549_9ACTN|nr:Gfo/Idh/MocA family oxidoreductase [Virgisporangium ochraceum]GIJ74737.1 oxidoreductase [Virgisporangium ochraceum]